MPGLKRVLPFGWTGATKLTDGARAREGTRWRVRGDNELGEEGDSKDVEGIGTGSAVIELLRDIVCHVDADGTGDGCGACKLAYVEREFG